MQNVIEKFKIIHVSLKKDEEEKKGESKKKSLGKGYLSFEQAKVDTNSVYIVVFRNMIGNTLYQGSVSGIYSKIRRIEEKAMKLQLKLALMVKDPNTKKLKVDHVVASFSRTEDLKDFEEKF